MGGSNALNLGSYIHVDDPALFDGLEDFTVGAWVNPSFNPSTYEPPDLDTFTRSTGRR